MKARFITLLTFALVLALLAIGLASCAPGTEEPASPETTEEVAPAATEAVIPRVTGSAYITGFNQFVLDDSDPFPEGFRLKA